MLEPTGVEGEQDVGTNWCKRRMGCWNQSVVEGEQGLGTNWCRRGTGSWNQLV